MTHEKPAAEPLEMLPVNGTRKFFVDLKFLWLEQMMEVRFIWYWYFFFSLSLPAAMVFGFTRFGSGLDDQLSLIYIVSGAAVFGAVSEGLTTMAIRIGSMRKEGMMIYYASLPISRTAFILALILSRLTITLPGMVAPLIVGAVLYDVNLQINFWVITLLPLTALALSVLGMVAGSIMDSMEMIQMLVNGLLFIMVVAAPVFIPMEALPLPFQLLGLLLPPTYAAAALRSALEATYDTVFYLNVAVLVSFTVLGFLAITRWLRWRLK